MHSHLWIHGIILSTSVLVHLSEGFSGLAASVHGSVHDLFLRSGRTMTSRYAQCLADDTTRTCTPQPYTGKVH